MLSRTSTCVKRGACRPKTVMIGITVSRGLGTYSRVNCWVSLVGPTACPNESTVYAAEELNYWVQKLMIDPATLSGYRFDRVSHELAFWLALSEIKRPSLLSHLQIPIQYLFSRPIQYAVELCEVLIDRFEILNS